MTTHEKLVLARNTLAKRGLARGGYMDIYGRVCSYGALIVGRDVPEAECALDINEAAIHGSYWDMDFVEVLVGRRALSLLFEWSDSSTLEEVLARMDEAIARTAPMPEDPVVEETVVEETVMEAVA